MSVSDAQKSEVHATTGDAESSPTPAGPSSGRDSGKEVWPDSLVRPLESMPPGTTIVRDETDDGGPLVIESDAPGLNNPDVPKDPFPTDRKPEIDPPIGRK